VSEKRHERLIEEIFTHKEVVVKGMWIRLEETLDIAFEDGVDGPQ